MQSTSKEIRVQPVSNAWQMLDLTDSEAMKRLKITSHNLVKKKELFMDTHLGFNPSFLTLTDKSCSLDQTQRGTCTRVRLKDGGYSLDCGDELKS